MKCARSLRCVALAVALAVAGCSESESIRVLNEPKSPPPAPPKVSPEQKQYRMLTAMVPADTGGKDNPRWWIFKMSGKADVVARHEADFNKLIATVHTSADEAEPITWELPVGWNRTEGGGSGFARRYATLTAPGGDAEIAVSQAGGSVLINIQRWWGQLWGAEKQSEITAIMLDTLARNQVVKGRLILRVDLSGPKDPNKKQPMMMNPHGGQ